MKQKFLHSAILVLCILAFSFAASAQKANSKNNTSWKLVYGKYGCTSSTWRNGEVEYTPRGFFTILSNGKYTYNGFAKPSSGSFAIDKDGNLLFKGGYFDGGKAEKIDRPNKFFLVFPSIPDHRWTCSLVDSK